MRWPWPRRVCTQRVSARAYGGTSRETHRSGRSRCDALYTRVPCYTYSSPASLDDRNGPKNIKALLRMYTSYMRHLLHAYFTTDFTPESATTDYRLRAVPGYWYRPATDWQERNMIMCVPIIAQSIPDVSGEIGCMDGMRSESCLVSF